jgi:hypothetical protein
VIEAFGNARRTRPSQDWAVAAAGSGVTAARATVPDNRRVIAKRCLIRSFVLIEMAILRDTKPKLEMDPRR